MLQFLPTAFVLSWGNTEESGSIFLAPSLQVFAHIDEIPLSLQSLHHLCSPSLDSLQEQGVSQSNRPRTGRDSRCSLTSAEYMERIISLQQQYLNSDSVYSRPDKRLSLWNQNVVVVGKRKNSRIKQTFEFSPLSIREANNYVHFTSYIA